CLSGYCCCCFFFSSRRRHTRCYRDWSSDVCSSDLGAYLDRYRIVEDPAPIRKSRQVASYDPENVRILRRRYGHVQTQQIRLGLRSEERRVGKECRYGWGREHEADSEDRE